MISAKLKRKELASLLRHKDSGNVAKAIQRGNLIEKYKLIDLNNPINRAWIEKQIEHQRSKGIIVDLSFDDNQPLDNSTNNSSNGNGSLVDNINPTAAELKYKLTRTKYVEEQIKTAQLNREIALGKYLRTSDVVEAVKIYLDQTMNIANTNLGNVITQFCKENGITSPTKIVKIKSKLTDALNLAIEYGRKEVMKAIDRMVEDQIEKLAKK